MLITLRIWFWIFIDQGVWCTGGGKVSMLRQKRHRIRLAKAKEKERLERKALTNWKEMVILYRLITRRLLAGIVMW